MSTSSNARPSIRPSPSLVPRTDSLARSADGVYKARFATSQQAYDAAAAPLFAPLDLLEQMLAGKDFLTRGRTTEVVDVLLFVTIARFDPIYVGHF